MAGGDAAGATAVGGGVTLLYVTVYTFMDDDLDLNRLMMD